MDRQKMLHEFVVKELRRYEALYLKMEKALENLPKGSLAIDRNGKIRRCVSEGNKQYMVMLSPKENDLFQDLKKRRYINKGLKVLEGRIENCMRFLQKDRLYDPKQMEKLLPKQYRGTDNLGIFLQGDIDPQEWSQSQYRRNPYPITSPHYTAGGIIVRSKSEAMIGTRLEQRGALFRTEPAVRLRHRTVYPDFKVLNTNRRRLMYWEHLGMVGDENYVFRNLEKLQEYADAGIILGENLFITYESKSRPLQIQDIDAVLDVLLK